MLAAGIKIFRKGLVLGLILQLAVGPVFFFVMNLVLHKTLLDGVAGVGAVTLVDYIYISLAVIGIGRLLEKKKVKRVLGIISSIVLIIFGVFMIVKMKSDIAIAPIDSISSNIMTSFITVFFLTISSPITIVFWTGIFAAKAVENNFTKRELCIFGLSAGLATPMFMGTFVVIFSLLKSSIPQILIEVLNGSVGLLLITYGVLRLKRMYSNARDQ